jgi:hypothetical protein
MAQATMPEGMERQYVLMGDQFISVMTSEGMVPPEGIVPDLLTDEAAATNTVIINAAITEGIATKKDVVLPLGTYAYNGYTCTAQGISITIRGAENGLTVLRKTQAAADAGGYMFMFNSSRYSTVSGLVLAANVKPNQQKIALTSVAGLAAGMVIQISSNRLWYNGHRDAYYCGEIHKITDVDTVAKTVTLEDFTRDVYTIGVDTLKIRAWVPNKVTIKNLRIEAPYPATVITSVGIAMQQCVDSIVENVSLQGFRNQMISNTLNWNTRFINVKFSQDDDPAGISSNGYGITNTGSVGTLVDGMYSKGLRRAMDSHSISGTTEAAPARDWRVTNFIVRGGGAWYPNTSEISYGIGMHGPSENGVISNGFIEDCTHGINARGRNTIVDNVTFAGTFGSAVGLYENGAGLTVRNCTYDSFNYPNKLGSLADVQPGSGASIFVRLGLEGSDVGSNCFYDLPIVISGNVAKGLTGSFVQVSQNTLVAKNLRVTNNHIEALPGAGNTFTTFYAPAANTNLTGSVFQNNDVTDINGSVVTWGTNLVVAYRESLQLSFKVDGNYYARIPVDGVVRIPKVVKAGQRAIITFHADAGGSGSFTLRPESTTIATMGATLATFIKATATGSSLTGTTGLAGEITFGLMLNGDLYIENRAAATYTFRLTIQ